MDEQTKRRDGLTDRQLKHLKRPERGKRLEVFDGNGSCLAARMTDTGSISFVLHYRWHGQTRRWVIGKYGHVSLKVARKRARAALVGLAKDPPVDPASGTREKRAAKTFGDVRKTTSRKSAARRRSAASRGAKRSG